MVQKDDDDDVDGDIDGDGGLIGSAIVLDVIDVMSVNSLAV